MTTLLLTRPKPRVRWTDTAAPDRKRHPQWVVSPQGTAAGPSNQTYHAVVMNCPAECGDPVFDQWQAELRLVECSLGLRLSRPLPEWLDDYRDLLTTALRGGRSAQKRMPRTAPRVEEIREFLQLMLGGCDKSAARFIRTSMRPYPFGDEMRRLRRVQALFASIRPTRSLAEALGFMIATHRHELPPRRGLSLGIRR
jgi:hypothetical protein